MLSLQQHSVSGMTGQTLGTGLCSAGSGTQEEEGLYGQTGLLRQPCTKGCAPRQG